MQVNVRHLRATSHAGCEAQNLVIYPAEKLAEVSCKYQRQASRNQIDQANIHAVLRQETPYEVNAESQGYRGVEPRYVD